MQTVVAAPKVNALAMWQMKPEDFNAWRRLHDYPRIIEVIKKALPEFESWMENQDITDELLIEYSPSIFLKGEKCIYVYQTIDDGKKKSFTSSRKLEDVKHYKGEIATRKDVVPYRHWYYRKNKKWPPQPMVNTRQGRSCRMFSVLELLDLGNCHLTSSHIFVIGNRLLDFVNISNLRMTRCINNSGMNLWFCVAEGMIIEGDFAFVNGYGSSFSGMIHRKTDNLKLLNGAFQSWKLENCEVALDAFNATIHLWEFSGYDFEATITSTDIRNCTFKSSQIRYPIDYGRHMRFHAHIKRLYSQIGKKKEASEHYYLEKTYERKSYRHVRENHAVFNSKDFTTLPKYLRKLVFSFKYIYSGFLNLLWGYGERPGRLFLISITTILLFGCGYCYLPGGNEQTHYHFVNSLYYSMVTFTTLGYGDISQTTQFLKLLSGLEALLGMTFWGILIAGFTSNSKDY
jgi:hypothetical protein